jgi:hypothetical protein
VRSGLAALTAGALALAPALGCRLFAPGPRPTPPVAVTFRFAPPDGLLLEQRLTTLIETHVEGFPPRRERSASRATIRFERRSPGYLVVAKLESFESMRDGRIRTDPLGELLIGVEVTYRVGEDGALQEIEGLAGIAEKAAAALPAPEDGAPAPALDEKILVARERAEWAERIGELAGATVAIGSSVEGETPYVLPNGVEIVYRTHTTFARFEPCGRARCVRVEQLFHSDPAVLASLVSGGPAPAREAEPAGPAVSGSIRRLVDPDTMLLHGEELARTVVLRIEVAERGFVPVRLVERRRYEFAYRGGG